MTRPVLVAAITILAVEAAALSAATPAAQQATPRQGGGMMGMHGPAMHSAMERLQQGMNMPSSGDPDIDFARMMIPHHQGAIDMAKSELQTGKDPELRQMAEEIVKAQEKEVEFLQNWLRKKGQ